MSGWTLRVVWPIEQPELFDHEAIAAATEDLPNVAAECRAVIAGTPTFLVVDCDPTQPWPSTPTAVVCEIPALPAITRVTCTAPTSIERTAA